MAGNARDYQVTAVYSAETAFAIDVKQVKFKRVHEVEDFINETMLLPKFRKRYGLLDVRVDPARRQYATAHCERVGRGFKLALPPAFRTQHYALHELAHAVTWQPLNAPYHSPAFCDALLRLIRWSMGTDSAYLLAHYYDLHGVDYD